MKRDGKIDLAMRVDVLSRVLSKNGAQSITSTPAAVTAATNVLCGSDANRRLLVPPSPLAVELLFALLLLALLAAALDTLPAPRPAAVTLAGGFGNEMTFVVERRPLRHKSLRVVVRVFFVMANDHKIENVSSRNVRIFVQTISLSPTATLFVEAAPFAILAAISLARARNASSA